MAKAKKKEEKKPIQVAGPSVEATAESLPKIQVSTRPGFRYTSPSAIPPRSAADRLAHGCERVGSKGKRKFTGRLTDGTPDTYCKPTSKPCGSRSSCPVQLVWIEGLPHLRFCVTPGEPGHVVRVTSPNDAQALATAACEKWPAVKKKVRWPAKFFEKNAPAVVARSRRERPTTPWGKPGLGEELPDPEARSYQKPPRFGDIVKAAAPFVAIGVLAGLVFRRQEPAQPRPQAAIP